MTAASLLKHGLLTGIRKGRKEPMGGAVPCHVLVDSFGVFVQAHREGPLFCASEIDVACSDFVCH